MCAPTNETTTPTGIRTPTAIEPFISRQRRTTAIGRMIIYNFFAIYNLLKAPNISGTTCLNAA